MKVIRLKTAVVEGNFDWTLVRIEIDEDVQGLGECFFAPGLTAILRSLERLSIGEDPRVNTGTSPRNALWGELMTIRAGKLGAAGAVLNGYLQDTGVLLSSNLPAFS